MLIFVVSSLGFARAKGYAELVDTRIGTQGSGLGCGFTFVAATHPFGMMQFGPTFFAPQKGIVVNQMSGAGCPNMGNFPAVALAGRLERSPNDMNSLPKYERTTRTTAGELSAVMPDGVEYDLTVSERSGLARFQFPDYSKEGTVMIGSGVNATFVDNSMVTITSPRSCEGFADSGEFCGSKTDYRVYFVAEFNKDAAVTGTWAGEHMRDGRVTATGQNSGAYFSFDTSDGKPVEYRISISYVSVANARENLEKETSGQSFEDIREATVGKWDKFLGAIDVSGQSHDREVQFYSSLYHTMLHPNVFSDVNGEYIGADFQVHTLPEGRAAYTTWSGWDTYRTQSQLVAMLFPSIASDMMQSAIDFADQAGGYGRWITANIETGIMHGDPMPIIIANSYVLGATDFDTHRAYEHMVRGANVEGTFSQNILVRPGLDNYIKNGFENASLCLEYTSADYAIGQYALKAMNNAKDAEFYTKRAGNWKNLFDPSTNWLRSRWAHDQTWKEPHHDWREATKENYFWMVPYDLTTLIDTIGGQEVASKRLDELFVRLDADYDGHHFAAGNEPNFLAPWVYNWTERPYKTTEVIHRVFNEIYSSKADGLPGNDDCGAMGAWYVFASVGLYPVIPGVAGFSTNTPQFDHIVITLESGKKINIEGGGADLYTKSMSLNGKPYRSTWIDWSELSSGANLQFKCSTKPNKSWGVKRR